MMADIHYLRGAPKTTADNCNEPPPAERLEIAFTPSKLATALVKETLLGAGPVPRRAQNLLEPPERSPERGTGSGLASRPAINSVNSTSPEQIQNRLQSSGRPKQESIGRHQTDVNIEHVLGTHHGLFVVQDVKAGQILLSKPLPANEGVAQVYASHVGIPDQALVARQRRVGHSCFSFKDIEHLQTCLNGIIAQNRTRLEGWVRDGAHLPAQMKYKGTVALGSVVREGEDTPSEMRNLVVRWERAEAGSLEFFKAELFLTA